MKVKIVKKTILKTKKVKIHFPIYFMRESNSCGGCQIHNFRKIISPRQTLELRRVVWLDKDFKITRDSWEVIKHKSSPIKHVEHYEAIADESKITKKTFADAREAAKRFVNKQ